jgi:carbamoyl-phosphate synthase small subunit
MKQRAYLTLENGKVFAGWRFGASCSAEGELVFTTGMTGYLETLTDPSYCGQIVVQTFPLIGNYGVIPPDFESGKSHIKAYIVREWCQEPSNFRSEGCLDTFLKEQGVPGLYGIDTRALTRIIREQGVMNAYLGEKPYEDLERLSKLRIENPVPQVTCGEISAQGEDGGKKVVLWDFGTKENISRELQKKGCKVIRVPAGIKAEELLALEPDGIMLSNGPGDPADNVEIIEELKKVFQSGVPIFGICLGHQLLALSQGAQTEKLKYGHRGANQPVLEIQTGNMYITSQNHGYAVRADSLPANARESFRNANDGTCEGIVYDDMPVFSVQFHPEACAGPRDPQFLFDRFMKMMGGNHKCR